MTVGGETQRVTPSAWRFLTKTSLIVAVAVGVRLISRTVVVWASKSVGVESMA